MKKIILITIALFLVSFVSAQENKENKNEIKTLFGNNVTNGGYGAFSMRYTQVAGEHAYSSGGRGGWIINHSFTIGGGGYGFNSGAIYDEHLEDEYRYSGGYGGLLLEYIAMPQKSIHLSFPLLIGAGGISYTTENSSTDDYRTEDVQGFLVVEPGVELELNVLRFMRVNFGVYYRFTSEIELLYDNNILGNIGDKDIMNGLAAGITVKFGRF